MTMLGKGELKEEFSKHCYSHEIQPCEGMKNIILWFFQQDNKTQRVMLKGKSLTKRICTRASCSNYLNKTMKSVCPECLTRHTKQKWLP